jgi:hypothetical protein
MRSCEATAAAGINEVSKQQQPPLLAVAVADLQQVVWQ